MSVVAVAVSPTLVKVNDLLALVPMTTIPKLVCRLRRGGISRDECQGSSTAIAGAAASSFLVADACGGRTHACNPAVNPEPTSFGFG